MDFRSLPRFASCLNLRGRDRAAACRRRARQLHLGSKHYLHPATKIAGSNNRRASLLVVKRLNRSVKAARSRIPKAMVDAKIKQAYAAQVAQNRRRSLPVDESEQQANLKRVQMMPTPPPSIAASNHLNTENGGSEPDSDSDIASSGPHSPRIGRSAVDPDFPHLHSTSSRPPTPPSSYQSDEQDTLTASQLYYAKILILDLLGWGVSPEYILDRGVSHKLIHTVFTELNLRLPEHIAADYAAITGSNVQCVNVSN